MAFASVNYAAAIWQAQGLKYIFRPIEESRHDNWQSTSQPTIARPIRPIPSAQDGQKSPAAPKFQWRSAAEAAPATARSIPKVHHQFHPLPLEQWPPLWREQFTRTRKGKIGWTYWQLGADLLGEGHAHFDKAGQAHRRSVMGRFLQALGMPGGTHTFWPTVLDEDQIDPQYFWSGVKTLECRGVLIFGEQAARILLGEATVPRRMEDNHNGFFVWNLKEMDKLEEEQGYYQRTVLYLRNRLSMFLR